MTANPRSLERRAAAARARLAQHHQLWLATGAAHGPHLIPVAFVQDGDSLVTATSGASRTVRNIRENGRVRVSLGPTDDVVVIDAVADLVANDDLPSEVAERYAAVSHDAREMPGYVYLRLDPVRIQVWNGFHEFGGRTVMDRGQWLTTAVD